MNRSTTSLRSALWLLLPVFATVVQAWAFIDRSQSPLMFGNAVLSVTPLLLLARRRLPITVFLATTPALYFGVIFPSAIALFSVALLTLHRRAVGGCAGLFGLVYVITPNTPLMTLSWSMDFTLLLGLAAWIAAPVALALLIRTRRALTARLDDLEQARAREDVLLAQQVRSGERARLAREMHDIVAHNVSLISVRTGALQVTTADPEVRATARELRTLAARTLDELRQMVGVLRASGGAIDSRAPQPHLTDLPQLIADSRLDVEARLDIPLDIPLDGPDAAWSDTVQRAVFRTVQEALTNVRKHAPGARVLVHLHESDRQLHVEVRNGPPAPGAEPLNLPTSGHGLTGLHERAHLAGGTLTAHATEDGGFLVHAAFPAPGTPRGGSAEELAGARVRP